MKSKVKILALVPHMLDRSASQRFRIEQWKPYLEEQGISVDFAPFANERLMNVLYKRGHLASKTMALASGLFRRSIQLASCRRYDAVFIHRAACLVGPAVLERMITLLRTPVIFDFDDAIYLLHTSAANKYCGWLKFPGKTGAISRMSSHVVVGNAYLAEYARKHNRRVTIIPSSVDTGLYRPVAKRASNGRVVVGWMGSSTSQTHLEGFAPVLRDLDARLNFELRVISDREPVIPGVQFMWRRWSAETEIRDLGEFDVGIMPMPDDQWARGKCAMKALLYMSMGVPVICSAVGTNREVIDHGQNGLLAATKDEWEAQLRGLIFDPAERARLGAAGRQTVEENFSMRRCASSFARVVQETVDKRRSTRVLEAEMMGKGRSVSRN
jgi:glycosyltransferase involved in cell wall biosynthesis